MSDFPTELNDANQQEVAFAVLQIAQAREKDVADKLGIQYAQLADVLAGKAEAIVTITYDSKQETHFENADVQTKTDTSFAEIFAEGEQRDVALQTLAVARAREQDIAEKLGLEYALLKDALENKANAQVLVSYSNKNVKKAKVYAKANGYRQKRTLRRTIAIVASFAILLSVGFVSVTYATPIKKFLQVTLGLNNYNVKLDYDQIPVRLKGFYIPQYLPVELREVEPSYAGLEEKYINRDPDGYANFPEIELLYSTSNARDGEWLEYVYWPYVASASNHYFDKETVFKYTYVNGRQVIYAVIEQDDFRSLTAIAENGDTIRLSGTSSEKELVKVLESIERIEE